MKKQIKSLPLTLEQLKLLKKDMSDWTKLALNTGLRLAELKYAAKEYHTKRKYIDIKRKGLSQLTRIYLNDNAIEALNNITLNKMNNVCIKTIQRAINCDIKHVVPLNEESNCHRLRSTFATIAINNGVNLSVLQTLMGHSDISMTAQYFVINDSSQINAIKLIGDVMNGEYDGNNVEFLLKEIEHLKDENSRLKTILEMRN